MGNVYMKRGACAVLLYIKAELYIKMYTYEHECLFEKYIFYS